jgi:hypothetical protein
MAIPGPSSSSTTTEVVAPTASPFWIRLHGTWLHLEGVVPGVAIPTDRPGSEMRSLDGHRYVQRARLGRRDWGLALQWAKPAAVAALRAAVEAEEVWFASDAALETNMLAPRDGYGTGSPIDCGGIALPAFLGGEVITGRVRGGVPTTLAYWSDATSGASVGLGFDYPGGGVSDVINVVGQNTVTFTPDADGEIVIEPQDGAWNISGLMLTEGTPAETWLAGEAMPCRVSIEDPAEQLTMSHHRRGWLHDYAVTVREVD